VTDEVYFFSVSPLLLVWQVHVSMFFLLLSPFTLSSHLDRGPQSGELTELNVLTIHLYQCN